MKIKPKALLFFFSAALLLSAITSCMKTHPDMTEAAIIPKPVTVVPVKGTFELSCETGIHVNAELEEVLVTGRFLASALQPATGIMREVVAVKTIPGNGNIFLKLTDAYPVLGGTHSVFYCENQNCSLLFAGILSTNFHGSKLCLPCMEKQTNLEQMDFRTADISLNHFCPSGDYTAFCR